MPAGFPNASIVEKAATLRVTRSGLDFLGSRIGILAARNLQPTGTPFVVDVPASSATGISICPNGPNRTASPPECTAEVNFANAGLRVDGVATNKVHIAGTVPVRVQNLRVSAVGFIPFGLGVGSAASCGSGGVPSVAGFTNVSISITAPLIGSPSTVRAGSTIIDSANAQVSVQIPQTDVVICNSFLPSFLTNGILSLAFSTLESTLADEVKAALGDATCQAPDATLTPACPAGSKPDDPDPTKWSKCVMNTNASVCVPTPLGVEGTIDVGSLIASFAPGTSANLDVLFAARGQLDPAPGRPVDNARYPGSTPNGLTLSFGGGALPDPKSACVPMTAPDLPTGIPVPDELRGDIVSGIATGPHLGLGVSERFLGYAFGQAVRSGLLCLDVSGERISLVNTAILSLIAKGLPTLAHEARTSAALVRLRPRGLPTVTVGGGTDAKTDPLLTIRLEKIRLEIYAWSYRRWVHAFDLETTIVAKADLDVVQNTTYPNGALVPSIGDVSLESTTVSQADLIPDDPAAIEANFKGLISIVAGRLGSLSAIDLSATLAPYGITIELPAGGVRRLTKGSDRFVGVFLNFGLAPSARRLPPPTVRINPASNGTDVSMQFANVDARTQQWSLAVDGVRRGGFRSLNDTSVSDAVLALDGVHEVGVSVRTTGIPSTESAVTVLPFRVDHEAPFADVDEATGEIRAWDRVSGDSLFVRRGESAAFERLAPGLVLSPGESADVRDESGLARSVQRASMPDAAASCAYSSLKGVSPSDLLPCTLLATLAGMVIARRRTRTSAMSAAAIALEGMLAGCSKESTVPLTGCGAACTSVCRPELSRGLTGSYLAATKDAKGAIWFSAYEDMAVVNGQEFAYGDWAIGQFNETSGEVAWQTVAGAPAPYTDGRCAERPASGYRQGRFEEGTDVGRSTALATSPAGDLFAAAYDATASALVFASRNADGSWSTHTASSRAKSDVGRHVAIAFRDGMPWLYYMAAEPAGRGLRTSIEVVRASSARPTKASDWTLDTVASVADGPCRQVQCDDGAWCSPTSKRCESVQTTCVACDGGRCSLDQPDGGVTCNPGYVAPSLETSIPAFGDGFAMLDEPSGTTFAVRDGTARTLVLVTPSGTGWTKTIVDGDPVAGVDRGTGPSLVRTSDGTLHLFSFDGTTGALTHVAVRGTQVIAKETVDDGSGVGSTNFDDAPHAFGRESVAAVIGGNLTVYYQDAKLAQLRVAAGTSTGNGAYRWALKAVTQTGKAAGFFPTPLEGGRVANFWRSYDRQTRSAFGGVAVVTP